MQSLRNINALYSRTVVPRLVRCILLVVLWLHAASATSQSFLQRCSLSLRTTERSSLKVQVHCDGSRRLSRQETFSEMPQNPWQIFPGLEVFGKDGTGTRSLVSIHGIDIAVFNSDFSDPLPQGFSISSPVSITNSTVLISDTQFLSFTTAEVSGGIYVQDSSLTVENCNFSGSLKGRHPSLSGAIYATTSSTLTVQRSSFEKIHSEKACILVEGNSSVFLYETAFKQNRGNSGAAVLVKNGGTALVSHCSFSLSASSLTGALTVIDGQKLLLENSSFLENSGKYGGALHVSANNSKEFAVGIRNSLFKNNTAEVNGGALYIASTTAQILDSYFETNTANFSGAGLYTTKVNEITVGSCSFIENNIKTPEKKQSTHEDDRDSGCGSAIFAEKADKILLKNLNFLNNTVPKSGGAGYFRNVQSLEIQDSVLEGNKGRDHSGLSIHEVGTFTMMNTSIQGHVARSHTGGVYIRSTFKVHLVGVSFYNNRAGKAGAAAMSVKECKDVEIQDCHLYRNFGYLAATGGLEIVDVATLKLSQATIHSNLAVEAAGAAIVAIGVTKSIVLESSSFRNNSAKFGTAGACSIQSSAALTVISSSFLYNVGHEFGGALDLVEVGRLVLENATFIGNEVGSGGAIAADSLHRLKINRSYFGNNKASVSFGGALLIKAVSHASVSYSTFFQNSAAPLGGGILTSSISDNLDFIGKTWLVKTGARQSHGGAIFIGQYKTVRIEYSVFRYNNASKNGGALFFAKPKNSSQARLKLVDTSFSNNRAQDGAGGAVDFDSLVIEGCEFNSNRALEDGGAVAVKHGISVSLVNAVFTENSLIEEQDQYSASASSKPFSSIYKEPQHDARSRAYNSISASSDAFGRSSSYWNSGGLFDKIHAASKEESADLKNGGAVVVEDVSRLEVKRTLFLSNSARNSGGALLIQEIDTFSGINNTFNKNKASGNGAALFIKDAKTVVLRSSLFVNNELSARRAASHMETSGDGGSVFFRNCRQVSFIKSQFRYNQAPGRGGAGFLNDIANLTIRKCSLEENLASCGGSLYFTETETVTIDQTNFTKNGRVLNSSTQSVRWGRAVQDSRTDSFLTRNGGALAATRAHKITITLSNFRANSAMGQGGASHWTHIDAILIEKVQFVDNVARAGGGGAISIVGASLTLLNSSFSHNQGFKGGSIAVVGGDIKAENVKSYGNYAHFDGGMVFCQDYSRINFTSSRFWRDLSGNGSAFKADCGCQLGIINSEGICSYATTEDCEVATGTRNCGASVVVKEAMHYLRPHASVAISKSDPEAQQTRRRSGVSTSHKTRTHSQPEVRGQSRDVQKQTVIVEQTSSCETWDPVHLVLLAVITTLPIIVLLCLFTKRACTAPWKRRTQFSLMEDSADESDGLFMHERNRDPAPVLASLRRQPGLLVPLMKDISIQERPYWDVSALPSSIPPTYTVVRGKEPLVSHCLHNVNEVCSPTASQQSHKVETNEGETHIDAVAVRQPTRRSTEEKELLSHSVLFSRNPIGETPSQFTIDEKEKRRPLRKVNDQENEPKGDIFRLSSNNQTNLKGQSPNLNPTETKLWIWYTRPDEEIEM